MRNKYKNNGKVETAVVLLAHGSSKDNMKKVLLKIKKKISDLLEKEKLLVFHAFLQMNKPAVDNVLNNVRKLNTIREIIILPIFVSHGEHTLWDLPRIVKKHNKKVKIKVAKPLESDDLLVKLLCKRYYEIRRN